MAFRVAPLQKLATLNLAKQFWNESFNSEDLQLEEIVYDLERNWKITLANIRDEAIHNLNNFLIKNKLPSFFKTTLTKGIFLLYQAYHQLLLWKITYDPNNMIFLLEKGELFAPNFFTVDGQFSDITWTKQYVADSNYHVMDRFGLACCYWFENECEVLWDEISSLYGVHLAKAFHNYFRRNIGLISLRSLTLQNQSLTSPDDKWCFSSSYWQMAFHFATKYSYEHAVYYIWQMMTASEKLGVRDTIFKFLSKSIDYPKDKIGFFLYSQLSNGEKEELLFWTIQHNEYEVWLSLLLRFDEIGKYSEIFSFIGRLPTNMLSVLLQSLSSRIRQINFPLDSELFHILWKNISHSLKYDVLNRETRIIGNLVKAESFKTLGYIIKCLSTEEKQMCLLHGWYGVDITILDILSKENEFDLSMYLSFFLFDMDPCRKIQILRKDAFCFLQIFLESSMFKKWYEKKTSKEIDVKERIDILQTNSILLHELCEEVCGKVNSLQTPARDFSLENHFAEIKESEISQSSTSSQKRKLEQETNRTKFMKM